MSAIGSHVLMRTPDLERCLSLAAQAADGNRDAFARAWQSATLEEVAYVPIEELWDVSIRWCGPACGRSARVGDAGAEPPRPPRGRDPDARDGRRPRRGEEAIDDRAGER